MFIIFLHKKSFYNKHGGQWHICVSSFNKKKLAKGCIQVYISEILGLDDRVILDISVQQIKAYWNVGHLGYHSLVIIKSFPNKPLTALIDQRQAIRCDKHQLDVHFSSLLLFHVGWLLWLNPTFTPYKFTLIHPYLRAQTPHPFIGNSQYTTRIKSDYGHPQATDLWWFGICSQKSITHYFTRNFQWNNWFQWSHSCIPMLFPGLYLKSWSTLFTLGIKNIFKTMITP